MEERCQEACQIKGFYVCTRDKIFRFLRQDKQTPRGKEFILWFYGDESIYNSYYTRCLKY